MMRLRWAVPVALIMITAWGVWLGYAAGWQRAPFQESLGRAALAWHLHGLSALCFARAADDYREAVLSLPEEADTPVRQSLIHSIIRTRTTAARILLTVGRSQSALAYAEQAHRADYDDVAAAAFMWRVRHSVGMAGEARRELLLLGLDNPVPAVFTALAEIFHAEARDDRALDFAGRAVSADAHYADAWLVQSRIHSSMDNMQDARSAAKKAWECATEAPGIRAEAADLRLELQPDSSSFSIAGRGIDYWGRVLTRWATDHFVFLICALVYILFLFSPAIYTRLRR